MLMKMTTSDLLSPAILGNIRAEIRNVIARVLPAVNAVSDSGPGWTRPSYSDLESQAHALIEAEASALRLEVNRDAAGNLFARMAGLDRGAAALYMGSHLDTVSQGGAYDGQAGVVGALAVLSALRVCNTTPPTDIVLVITRAEESVWFPVSYVGSRAAIGLLDAEDFEALRSDTGRSLADHMADQGYDAKAARCQTPLAPARFLEFHIEQGPVLDAAGEKYAVVETVRGSLRYRTAQVHGAWAHSGGSPRDGRADAVLALAELIVAMNAVWGRMLAKGVDQTVTFGRVEAATFAHSMAKVPGHAGFCLDMRSDDPAVLNTADSALTEEIARIEAAHRGIRFDLGYQTQSSPADLSQDMARWVENGAAMLGDNPRRMLSGGGHDAAAFAAAGWDSVMVFIRNSDGSHCPEEGMDQTDLAAAAEAVLFAIIGDA
jgi:N-carbamoyl-L-amino-acid hydrolase